MSDYWKKKMDELEKETKKSPSQSYWGRKMAELEDEKKTTVRLRRKDEDEDDDDIAPIKSTKDDGKLDFFQKGALGNIDLGKHFEDGYQFGDILKTAGGTALNVGKAILGTAGDAGLNAVKGVAGLGEGIGDLISYGIAGVADVTGHDAYADRVRKRTQESVVDKLMKPAEDYLDNYSILGRTSDAILQGVGQVGGIIATGNLGAAAGLGSGGVTVLTTGIMGLSGVGSGMGEAYQSGANDLQALKHGLNSGAADAVSELIFGGLGKGVNALGFSRGLSSADDMLAKLLGSKFKNQAARNLVEFGIKSGAEGLEEVIAGVAQAYSKYHTYLEDQGVEFIDVLKDENLLEQFIVGSFASGISQTSGLHIANKTGTDFITGMTQNEQAVVKKELESRIAEAEEDGRKLTAKEKAAIEAEVERDLEKGYISTDLIEEVVGGETYKAYHDSVEKEDALFREYEELGKTANATLAQQDRYRELGERVKSIRESDLRSRRKGQLDQFVADQVRGTRLAESYNERARRGQAFTADLSKYDAKQRTVIQRAIDSGILNDTNRTHEFVDMVAKISADKGVLFDFTNNEKLKASGFAVDGRTVNGFVTKDGITVNIQSRKALKSLVGHEITHVLEGTDLYAELQEAVASYAKTKGDYQGRFDAMSKLYEAVEGADITAELTADLVGDYLFTDTDFINSLSANHRNVFQKIYDEVKYLVKVAVAGSKEARELEKVKRAFEKAYRESGDTQSEETSETKYSIVEDQETIDFLENQEHIVTYKAMVLIDGKLYPPMASEEYVDEEVTLKSGKKKTKRVRKLKNPSVLGKWQKSDERPDLVTKMVPPSKRYPDGYGSFDLLKSNGKTVKDVAYNPYEHTSNIVLNDQFSEAYQRPELVTVEYHIPASELTSGYKAQYAKDSVGLTDWKAGGVAQKLKNSHRDVYLTRWSKPVRVVPDSEVAQKYKEILDKEEGISVPWNVVTPSLRTELEKIGVPIDYSDIKAGSTVRTFDAFMRGEYDKPAKKKAKYSLTDSDGRQLSEEQAEYFKNSKMRDDNGNLIPMYHGTSEGGFHVFDPGHSDDGISLFFVDSNDVASSYSGTSETYSAQTFKTAEDFNEFFARISADEYEVRQKDGKFYLYEDGDVVAESSTAEEIYEEFRDWSGLGYGDVNYKVYLNLENPLVVDAEGRNWNRVTREFSQEIADKYHSLTTEEKAAVYDLAQSGDVRRFRRELDRAWDLVESRGGGDGYTMRLASAYQKLGEDINMYDFFAIAKDNFSEQAIKTWAVNQMGTREYAQKAKAEGYDGVIFKNILDVGYYGGTYNPHTVAIAFNSNQIKSVANQNPTGHSDIRYSLSEDTNLADNARSLNAQKQAVADGVLSEAIALRQDVAARLKGMKENGVAVPEDIKGNTAISNSSYDITEENTTICPRSLAAEAFVDAVSEYLGRPLTVEEQIYISQDLQGRSMTPECTYCYVATDRKAYRAFLGEYINQRNAVIGKVKSNPNADTSRSGEMYKAFLNGRKDTDPMYRRFKMWVDTYKTGKPMVEASHLANINKLMGDINSEFGAELKPQIVDAMKYAQSASWAKKRVSYVAYDGHILKWKQDRINKLNSHYGLRMYSFSDFHPAFVLENMQMITDASVRGLKMLGYTKDIDFVEIFAPSGMNINVSTFGFESGGNVYENNIIGAEWEKAKALRQQYPNVGITFVATNDTLVDWALNQDWIDVVIPYHLVRTGAEVAKAFGYTNYTSESSDTKTKSWAKGDQKYIAPTEHNNDKATYLAALEKNHLKPRFERFLAHPNYMKLVNECRQPASESKPVQPVFNREATMVALAKLEANGYYQPIGGSVDRMYEIAAEVAEDMTKQLAPKMSLSDAAEVLNSAGSNEVYGEDIALEAPAAERQATGFSYLDAAAVLNPDIRYNEPEKAIAPEAPSEKSKPAEEKAPAENGYSGFSYLDAARVLNPDIKYNVPEEVAPVSENSTGQVKTQLPEENSIAPEVAISETETTTEESTAVEDLFPDDLAPVEIELDKLYQQKEALENRMTEALNAEDMDAFTQVNVEYDSVMSRIEELENEISETESARVGSLEDTDAPPEAEALYPGEPNVPADPFADRDMHEVGNRKVKAYQFENPEVKPFFREAALGMLDDLSRTTRGEKIYNGDVYYQSGGEEGWMGTKRQTTSDIAELLDQWHYTYAEIEEGLKDIIEDNGKENNAVSKRIEFMLDERLRNGYTDVWGESMPANQEYINFLNEKQITEYSKEAFDSLFAQVDEVVPQAEEEDIAPVQQKPEYVSTASGQMRLPLYHDPNNVSPAMDEVQADGDIAPMFEAPARKGVPEGQQAMWEIVDDPIAKRLAKEKAALAKEYQQKKAEVQRDVDNKNAYISRRASELYQELRGLQKGVKASDRLSFLLDHGYEWSAIRAALVNIKHTPDKQVNQNSVIENIARQMLNEDYEDRVYELSRLESEYQQKVVDAEKKADEERTNPRATRKTLHANIMDNIKGRFAKKGFDFDKVLKNARNLSTFATVDNTPQRVMEKALGYKEGGILADITVNQVAQNETKAIKWLNFFTDRKTGMLAQISKQYHIKPGSKASAAAQMYAEGFYVGENDEIISYGDRELALDFPDPVRQAQIKGLARDQRIRKIYDDTLSAINESRTRNAYPEIPRLDNYFLHFRAMNDTFSRLGLPFNPNDIRAKDLPTDLNGVTADLKPGQPYFASAQHRTGKRTSFDLLGGLEQYLTSAKNQIYHIDDIQTLRALRNYIADTYGQANGLEGLDALSEEEQQQRIEQVYSAHLSTFAKFLNEEANVLAGKTALIDRGIEGIIGRRGMTFLETVNRQVGANMVGFNVSSSLTNFLAPVQALAKTSKASFIKGMAQFTSNKVLSIFGKGDNFELQSPVMIRRKGAESFHRTFWQKMSDTGYVLMSAVDEVSTELIARAKYNEFVSEGMDSQKAHIETDKWVSRLMGDRSLGQQPQLYNSKMLGIFTKFQLEVRNQLDSQFYDTIQETKASNEYIQNALLKNAKTAAKITSTFVQLAIGQHLFGKAFEAIAGYNPAFDIISAIIKAVGWDDEEESEDTVLDNIEQGFFELMEDMPYYSIFSGGRIPIESALPVAELIKGKDQYGNDKSRLETLGEAAPYYFMPAGYGQLKKTAAGLDIFSEDHPIAGSYTDSGNLRFPVEDTPVNRAQAAIFGQYASGNARDFFDNERTALKPNQIQEFMDVGMSIQDYWKYRDGLKGLSKLEDKINYINGLNLTTDQKNILINNLTSRKEDIDLDDYDEYSGLDEFDFANKNPEKYAFFEQIGITYDDYKNADKDARNAYDWAFDNPDKYPMAKAVGDVVEYRRYASELYDIKADRDSSGRAISGSRKEKVLDYINSLDIDYGAKLILFKNEYNADDESNYEIIEYLNSRSDINFEETVAILRELGFTVTDEGDIYWD